MWNCHRSTDNRYSGDNRLIGLESSHRQSSLAPRHTGVVQEQSCNMYWLITVEPSFFLPNGKKVIPWEVAVFGKL